MKKIWLTSLLFFAALFLIWSVVFFFVPSHSNSPKEFEEPNAKGIHPSSENPQYWSYNGKKTMLLGGSVEDNLFQIENLEAHLNLLKSVGGNYVRNTMSSRDPGNVWPFLLNADSLFNLDRWNETYWNRFDHFLKATGERDIIVQMEIWATFDFYRSNWEINPFNPKNNINYSQERTHLPLEVNTHPIYAENNFFRSVPDLEHNIKVLQYQQKYVDKILSYSLKYGHILYCMDNETSVTAQWGKFWSEYIQKKAAESGSKIHTTEMWDPWDLNHLTHRETFDHPELYSFVDISQNNHNEGDTHWENGLHQIARLKQIEALRPVNNVKIYGNDGGRHKTTRNGIECFVRNVMMGTASARFHRPTSGQGLNETAQKVIGSMRSYIDKSDFFNSSPFNRALLNRQAGQAYCRAIEGKEYAVYFPNGGSVNIDLTKMGGPVSISWLNILKNEWFDTETANSAGNMKLNCPETGHWLALITKN